MLRDPASLQISWIAYKLNFDYFLHYPSIDCEESQHLEVESAITLREIERLLKSVETCRDTPFRRNLTILYTVHKLRSLGPKDPGVGVTNTARWVTGSKTYEEITSKKIIKVLKSEYFLVATTEYLDEFLVLIALSQGWKLQDLYYRKCKPSNLSVHRQEFERLFPKLIAKLDKSGKPLLEAYTWARAQFAREISKLGPAFQDKVAEFKQGLKEFQAEKRGQDEMYKWNEIRYRDNHRDVC